MAGNVNRGLAALVLVTAGYNRADGDSHATIQPRVIPLPNPNAPKEHQDLVAPLNSNAGEEWFYSEVPTVMYVETAQTEKVSIRSGQFYVDDHCFGPLGLDYNSRSPAFTHVRSGPTPPRLRFELPKPRRTA